MSNKHIITAFMMLALSFTSCKKEVVDEVEIILPTKTELLTNKFWDLVSETESVNGGPDEELLVNEEECEADDLIYFFTNNVFQETDGALSCDSLNPFFYESTWAFSAGQDSIVVDGGYANYIDNLTSTELRLREMESDFSGDYVNYYTYSAQ